MDVKCDKCQARYRIDDARVGAAGLTMRCGKCGNTFKVTKGGATQSVGAAGGSAPPPAGKPAPAAPAAPAGPSPENSTMMFAAPVIPPAKAAPTKPPPLAGKPAPAAAKPAPRAMADDAAGSTMMFNAPPIAPPSKPAPPAAKPLPESDAGSTMMFAAAPIVAAKTDASKAAKAAAAKAPPQPAQDAAGATMMFAAAPQPVQPAKGRPAPVALPDMLTEPGAPPAEEEPARTEAPRDDEPEEQQQAEAEPAPEPIQPRRPSSPIAPMAREQPVDDDGIVAEGAEHTQDAPLVPRQKKFPVVPVAIAAALVVVILIALFAMKRFGKQLPTPDAVEQMAQAHAAALKDTPADYAVAEGQAKGALQLNERAFFPIGWAELAEIEVGWADALRESNGSASEVKGRLNAALNAINAGLKQDAQNADLMIAQADYYRSTGSPSYSKAIKRAQSLAASDARVAFVQGMAAAAEDDGAEKALPFLKPAAAALGSSARVHYRYALALAAAKQDEAAAAELAAALKISPAHERAKKLLDEQKAKGGSAAPAQEAPPPADPKGAKKGK